MGHEVGNTKAKMAKTAQENPIKVTSVLHLPKLNLPFFFSGSGTIKRHPKTMANNNRG